jgi:hypothetical protein
MTPTRAGLDKAPPPPSSPASTVAPLDELSSGLCEGLAVGVTVSKITDSDSVVDPLAVDDVRTELVVDEDRAALDKELVETRLLDKLDEEVVLDTEEEVADMARRAEATSAPQDYDTESAFTHEHRLF